MIPSPGWMVSAMTASPKLPRATNGRKTRPSSSARKTALVSPVKQGLRARSAMRRRTEPRSSIAEISAANLGEGGHLGGRRCESR